MISALALFLAASGSRAPQTVDLAALVETSNRLRYEAPEATTRLDYKGTGFSLTMRDARQGERSHFEAHKDDVLLVQSFTDGKRAVFLQYDNRTYSESAITKPRVSYAETTKEPLAGLTEENFDLRFDSNRGVILRSLPEPTLVNDEGSVTMGDETWRRLTYKVARPDDEETTVDFRILVDPTGLIRRIEGEAKSEEIGQATFLVVTNPKVAPDEPFTFDVATLTDWTRVGDGTARR